MVADEMRIIFELMAAELTDVVHTVSFVEPEVTQTGTARTLRFVPGSLDRAWLDSLFHRTGAQLHVDVFSQNDFREEMKKGDTALDHLESTTREFIIRWELQLQPPLLKPGSASLF